MTELRTYNRVICFALLALAACNPPDGEHSRNEQANATEAAEPTSMPTAPKSDEVTSWVKERYGMRVTRAGFEGRRLTWPLNVDTALIGCERPELIWLEA